ncbi:MAG: ParA family protein [Pseudomonadota bacterium]
MEWLGEAIASHALEVTGVAVGLVMLGALIGALPLVLTRRPSPRGARENQRPEARPTAPKGASRDTFIDSILTGRNMWARPLEEDATRPIPVAEGGIPIVTIANLKGGVGKTTITANLAAYFTHINKRALLIDLDYQGSLTATLLTTTGKVADFTGTQTAERFLQGDANAADLKGAIIDLDPTLKCGLVPSYYELQQGEDTLMLSWLAGLEQRDIRFSLSRVLTDPIIQQAYDLVLIDAPPRLTAGFINALCATTHLFIPAILDKLSAEAATYFARQVVALADPLCPNILLGGVIPSRTSGLTNDTLNPYEAAIANYLDRELNVLWKHPEAVLRHAKIPNGEVFARVAGHDIAFYAGHEPARDRLVALGEAVGTVIGVRP